MEFCQTANGSVLCHEAVPSEFLTKTSTSKTDQKVGKEEFQEEESSPTKESRHDQGQPRETSWHEVKRESVKARHLWEISSTAEIIEENKSSEVHVQCNYCTKRKQIRNSVLQMWKEAWRIDSVTRQERSSDKGCQIMEALVQLRIVEQVRREQRHGTSEDQGYWAVMRDHFRRCTRKGVVDAINKQKIFFEGCVDRLGKRRIQKKIYINGHTKEELQSRRPSITSVM